MRTTFFAESLLLLLHSSAASTHLNIEGRLNPLDDILAGPASRKQVFLHHDPALPTDTLHAIKALQGVRNIPQVSFASHHNCTTRSKTQSTSLQLHGATSSAIHILIFLDYKPKLLQDLCSCWTPSNLLLYSLVQVNVEIVLEAEVLVRVTRLALITDKHSPRKYEAPVFVVYTQLPFSSSGHVFLGEWSLQKFSALETFLINRYPNFEGYKFEIASWVGEMPFIYRRGPDQPVVGVSIEMLHCLSSVLNFTYTLLEKPHDSKIGETVNGSWDGLFGLVYRMEKQFTINNIYLSGERTSFFDASVPCWQDGYGVFLRQPETLPKWASVYRTFTLLVWSLIFTFIVIITLFLYVQVSSKCFCKYR